MAVRFRWNGEQVMAKVRAEVRRRLARCASETRRQVVTNISRSNRGFRANGSVSGSRPGEYPTADRGFLRKSIFDEVLSDTRAIVGVDAASPASKYARRLEQGGIIRASGKLMAVPISQKAKAHSYNGGPRTLGIELTRISRAGKPPLLVEIPRGKTRPWTIHYVLTPKVTIAARPYLARTVTEMTPRYQAIFQEPMSL